MKKCFYDILQLDHGDSSSTDDIRQAYKKLALQHHPDKNRDTDKNAANELFRSIREAYECLSDEHERAWYDAHKHEILASDPTVHSNNVTKHGGSKPQDPSPLNLWSYFSRDCFLDFDDNETLGFYYVYGKLFVAILNEQIAYLNSLALRKSGPNKQINLINRCKKQWNTHQTNQPKTGHLTCDKIIMFSETSKAPSMGCGVSPSLMYDCSKEVCYCEIAVFGTSKSPWVNVSKFYNYWEGYSSSKSFAFADVYKTSDAENRFVRRRMEQENSKLRKAAKKEYNDLVRNLVLYIKKRDPRVISNAKQNAANQLKKVADEAELQKRLAEIKRVNREKYRIEEIRRWEEIDKELATRADESHNLAGSRDGSGTERKTSESESDQYLYKCTYCKKTYKSLSQWVSHENSKKHKKLSKGKGSLLQT